MVEHIGMVVSGRATAAMDDGRVIGGVEHNRGRVFGCLLRRHHNALAYGKAEGVVVDTHVQRLSRRLDFSKEERPEKIEQDLMQLFPREKWSFSAMVGSATLTIETSRIVMKKAAPTTASASQRRGSGAGTAKGEPPRERETRPAGRRRRDGHGR